jgi:EmrB/QacA subfamily drug resistance transporter
MSRDLGNRRWTLVVAILGSSMAFIDSSATNVILPVLQADLHASVTQVQWVVEGYALFLSALILIGGGLGDILGRRAVFVAGIIVFSLASIACALAPSAGVLIIARCVQGIGGAFAIPGSLALVSAVFDGAERGRAVGTWSAFSSLTAAGGPVLGGFLAQHATWRDVFLINVPLAFAVVVIAVLRVDETRDARASHAIDWGGAMLATTGLGAIVYGLIRMQIGGGDALGVGSVVVGSAALVVFVVHEKYTRAPMMPLFLFRSRAFSAITAYTFLLYAMLGGALYFLPFVLIDVQRLSPSVAGAAFLPFIMLQVIFARSSGALVAKVGARMPLCIGAFLASIAYVMYALAGVGATYWSGYFWPTVVLGLAGVCFVAPLTTAMLDAVATTHSGIASGINNAVARSAGLIAVAAFGIVLATTFDHDFDTRLAVAHVQPQTRALARSARAQFVAGTVPPQVAVVDRAAVGEAIREAYLAGFRRVMEIAAATALSAAIVALFLIPRKARPNTKTVTTPRA